MERDAPAVARDLIERLATKIGKAVFNKIEGGVDSVTVDIVPPESLVEAVAEVMRQQGGDCEMEITPAALKVVIEGFSLHPPFEQSSNA